MKLPYIQFYTGDWKKDMGVQSLSYHDRGVLFEILLIMHESENRGTLSIAGAPISESMLERMLHLDNQNLKTCLTTLINLRVLSRDESTGVIYSRRMVREEELRKTRQKSGKMGGNPVLVKQKDTSPLKETHKQTSEDDVEDEDNPSGGESKGEPSQEELIYSKYPRKVGKPVALRAIKCALVKVKFEILIQKTERYAKAVDGTGTLIPHPATFFNQERYNDDESTWRRQEPVSLKPNGHPSGKNFHERAVDKAIDRLFKDLE
jgi:hypothetical protein